MRWRKTELIFDPKDGPYRSQSVFQQVFWRGAALVALAAIISAAFLLLAGLFTLLAFVLPIVLMIGVLAFLLNRHRTRSRRRGSYFDLDLR